MAFPDKAPTVLDYFNEGEAQKVIDDIYGKNKRTINPRNEHTLKIINKHFEEATLEEMTNPAEGTDGLTNKERRLIAEEYIIELDWK